jgi:hypothetical protein
MSIESCRHLEIAITCMLREGDAMIRGRALTPIKYPISPSPITLDGRTSHTRSTRSSNVATVDLPIMPTCPITITVVPADPKPEWYNLAPYTYELVGRDISNGVTDSSTERSKRRNKARRPAVILRHDVNTAQNISGQVSSEPGFTSSQEVTCVHIRDAREGVV